MGGGGMLFLGVTNRSSFIHPWPQRDLEISQECLSSESPWGEKGKHHSQPLG